MSNNGPAGTPVLTPEHKAALAPHIDKPARRRHMRGLQEAVLRAAREKAASEFRAEDLVHFLRADYPLVTPTDVGSALATLTSSHRGIERIGVGRSGLYRCGGTAPNLDDDAVLDNALSAIASLEAMVRKYRDLQTLVVNLRKALG